MRIERRDKTLTISLESDETSLLRDTLKRATFEDTPPERQRRILDFATELLRRLEEA